jgi:hypothetical protein
MEIQFSDFSEQELTQILHHRTEAHSVINHEVSGQLARLYQALRSSESKLTLREMIKWTRRQKKSGKAWPLVGYVFLVTRLTPFSLEVPRLQEKFKTVFPGFSPPTHAAGYAVQQEGKYIRFINGELTVRREGILTKSMLFHNNKQPPSSFLIALVHLAFACDLNEPVCLVGPSCYKTLLVETWIKISSRMSSPHNNFTKVIFFESVVNG